GTLLRAHRRDDALLAQPSRTVVAEAERYVASEELRRTGDGVILEGIHVTALVEAPRGARPSLVRGVSPIDADQIREYVAAAVDDAAFKRYLDRYVYD